jgi:predicted phosphoribosyltransferase
VFESREDAARQLAERFAGRQFKEPLVLAIPRGGIITGAAVAKILQAELDVILSRKLRAPDRPNVHIGAVCEDKRYVLTINPEEFPDLSEKYLADESQRESREIERLKNCFRHGRAQAPIRGRSVIVTDDGITTGASMIAALEAIRLKEPFEVIVGVPLAANEQIEKVRRWCDEVVCLLNLPKMEAVREHYREFPEVSDTCIVEILDKNRAEPEPECSVRHHGPVCPPIGVMTEKEWSE